jgi:hypothetical protein
MSLTISEKKESSVPLLEPGTYPAVCCQLIDLGMQYNENFKTSSRKVLLGWEIIGETVEIGGESQPRTFAKIYTASLNEKASLRKDLNAWRGRPFTEEELAAFDMRSIVGAPCLVTIIHNQAPNGNTYANMAGISSLPKGYPRPALSVKPTVYDIDADDPAVVDTLPKWIGEKIRSSSSYQERMTSASTLHDLPDEDDGELPF